MDAGVAIPAFNEASTVLLGGGVAALAGGTVPIGLSRIVRRLCGQRRLAALGDASVQRADGKRARLPAAPR